MYQLVLNIFQYVWTNILMHVKDIDINTGKLNEVGPVDIRPSTNTLHHLVQKEKEKKWHVTRDTFGG